VVVGAGLGVVGAAVDALPAAAAGELVSAGVVAAWGGTPPAGATGASAAAGVFASDGAAAGAGAGVAVAGAGVGADGAVESAAGPEAVSAAGALSGAVVATAVDCVAGGLGSSPSSTSRSCTQVPSPEALDEHTVTTGPMMMSATTTRVATAAPMVTARGRVGAESASCFSRRIYGRYNRP